VCVCVDWLVGGHKNIHRERERERERDDTYFTPLSHQRSCGLVIVTSTVQLKHHFCCLLKLLDLLLLQSNYLTFEYESVRLGYVREYMFEKKKKKNRDYTYINVRLLSNIEEVNTLWFDY